MFICSISQNPTLNPVLSLKSNLIFDADAIKTYVNTYGIDPISKESMTPEDIVSIKPTVPPSTMTAANITQQTSIPTMLQSFQDAWDALSLELFQLRSNLDQTRKDLSLALYKQDAAVRVALKASKERDELLKALAELGSSTHQIKNITTTEVDEKTEVEATPEHNTQEQSNMKFIEFSALLEQEQQTLFAKHKIENKQHRSKTPIKSSDFELSVSIGAEVSSIGSAISKCVLNGSLDRALLEHSTGQIELLELVDDKLISKYKYENGKALPLWLSNTPYAITLIERKRKGRRSKKSKESVSVDLGLLNILKQEDDSQIEIPIETTSDEIVDIIPHPSLNAFIVLKKREMFVCQLSEEKVEIVYHELLEVNITAGAIHPDGVLFARALDEGAIEIVDLSSKEIKLTVTTPSSDENFVESVKFASNGYSLVIEYSSSVGVYDLRKADFQSLLEKPENSRGTISIDQFSTLIQYGTYFSTYNKKTKTWTKFSSSLQDDTVKGVWLLNYTKHYNFVVSKDTGVFIGVA